MKSVGSSPVKRWALGLALAALLGAPTARAQVAGGSAASKPGVPATVPTVDGRNVAAVMADYFGKMETPIQGFFVLRDYLTRHPERGVDVARALDAYAGDKKLVVVGTGFATMSFLGTAEAQRVLLVVASEPGWKTFTAEQALGAMMDLKNPELSLVRAIWKLRASATRADSELDLSIVTNTYGALGDARKGNKAITAEVVNTLGRHLKGTSDMYERVLALDALSNAGDPNSVIPLAAPFFASSDEEIRKRAFSTFRLMSGDDVFRQFAERYAAETSVAVRYDATRTAEAMVASAARSEWALRELGRTTDSRTMSVLVDIVGREIPVRPENAAVLRTLLAKESDRAVRRSLYAYIAPTNEGGK